MRPLLATVAAAWLAVIPVAAWSLDLRTGGGFLFDVTETGDGSLNNGTIDAYDVMYALDVDGLSYTGTGSYSMNLDDRGVKMPEVQMGALLVRRLIYVPKSGGNYARYLEVLTNRGTTDVVANVTIHGNLGSDSTTVLVATSSGGTTVSAADSWLVTDDEDAGGDPSLAHVIQGPGARVRASTVALTMDDLSWSFVVPVAAGTQAAVLTFAVQDGDRAHARAEAERLVTLPPDAMVGLEDYRAAIVNFAAALAEAEPQ